jgi:hypothetical protein
LRDLQLQLYLQQFRDIDVQNRNTYTLEDGLYIGRKGLGAIATNFRKIIISFHTARRTVDKVPIRHAAVYFPDSRHHFYISDRVFKNRFKQYHDFVKNENFKNKIQLPSLRT